MNRSVSLKARLTCALLFLGMLCLVVGTVGIRGIQNANARAQRTYETLTLPAQTIETSYLMTLAEVIQLMEGLASDDESTRQQRLDFIAKLQKDSDALFATFQNSTKDDSIKAASLRIEQDHAKFDEVFRKAVDLLKEGRKGEALSVEGGELRPYGVKLFEGTMQISSALRDQAEAANAQDVASYRRTMTIMVVVILLGGMATGAYAWIQLRLVGSSIGSVQKALQHVSETLDLTRRAPVERLDEIGLAGQAFNHLMERVAEVIGAVHGAVKLVAMGSKEIASGNADLSSRTEQQAASLEETSASMEELTGTVRQNAANARAAATLVTAASETANRGTQAVSQVVGTMGKIRTSSARIAEITGMIEGIAFQTNILALNAAVEAARAGEQGRGFAVVAGEVRLLAQRAASAAKEIKDLIGESVARVEAGSKQVNDAAGTIDEIVKAVTKVAGLVQEIAAASEEQERGISQVGLAVAQMDHVTQQNAALVEQAAAATRSMEDQAHNLRNAVEAFRLADRDYLATTSWQTGSLNRSRIVA